MNRVMVVRTKRRGEETGASKESPWGLSKENASRIFQQHPTGKIFSLNLLPRKQKVKSRMWDGSARQPPWALKSSKTPQTSVVGSETRGTEQKLQGMSLMGSGPKQPWDPREHRGLMGQVLSKAVWRSLSLGSYNPKCDIRD